MKSGIDYIGITCVFYCHDGKGNLVLHQRSKKCRDEVGKWDCGGGAMRLGETFEETLKREIKEEYCSDIIDFKFAKINNVLRKNGNKLTHWIALIFAVKIDPKKVKLGNPEKMEKLQWFSWNKLPTPLHSMFVEHFQFVEKYIVK